MILYKRARLHGIGTVEIICWIEWQTQNRQDPQEVFCFRVEKIQQVVRTMEVGENSNISAGLDLPVLSSLVLIYALS